MNLQSICKHVDLNRRPFRINAVISMNECIEHSLTNSRNRILRPIAPSAGSLINTHLCLHIAPAENKRLSKNLGQSSFYALIIQETCIILTRRTDFLAWNDNCRNAKLREKPLRIYTKIQQSRQRRLAVAQHIQQLIGAFTRNLCKPWTLSAFLLPIGLGRFQPQIFAPCPSY